MHIVINPFLTSGYIAPEYFCDRKEESKNLIREVTHGNNLALISTRRMGKTGLIRHCFEGPELKSDYYTFFVDIYATKSLREFVFALSKVIVEQLQPFGKRAIQRFWDHLRSIQSSLSFDINGNPSVDFSLSDIHSATATLDEIFGYLQKADKPCIVAIDEFQQIACYPEENVEALLRTHLQQSPNARFIFAGSQQHTMANIFASPARPFYQSVAMMHLAPIPLADYIPFAQYHFGQHNKQIEADTIRAVYEQFEGITWYVQKVLHVLFALTPAGGTASEEMLSLSFRQILDSYRFIYSEILFRIPEKQKELLIAINKAGRARQITSGAFIKQYKLSSTSSVQSALKGLIEKDFITSDQQGYRIYDLFFGMWLRENYG